MMSTNTNSFRRGGSHSILAPQNTSLRSTQSTPVFQDGFERSAAAATTKAPTANSVFSLQSGAEGKGNTSGRSPSHVWRHVQRGVGEASARNQQGTNRRGEERLINQWAHSFLQKAWVQQTIHEFTHSQRSLGSRPSDQEHDDEEDDDEPMLDSKGNPIPPLHQALLRQSARCRQEKANDEVFSSTPTTPTRTLPLHERQVRRILQILESDKSAASRPIFDKEYSEIYGRGDGIEFPLHKVIRERYPDDIILAMLHASTNQVVGTPDRTGTLPLHAAILNQSSEIVIYSLVNLYPAAATLPMPTSRTFHFAPHGNHAGADDQAAEKKKMSVTFSATQETTTDNASSSGNKTSTTSVMKNQSIELVEEAAEIGFLPFHCAHVLGFSVKLVGIFFDLYKSEARQQRLYHEKQQKQQNLPSSRQRQHVSRANGNQKILPLHYVIHHRLPEKFILEVLANDPKAARIRYDHDRTGDLPLHRALRFGLSDCIVLNLLKEFSHAPKIRNYQHGRLPLHEAASSHGMTPAILRALLRRYPQALNEPDADGRCPRYFVEPQLGEESIDLLFGVKDHAYPSEQEHIIEEETILSKSPLHNVNSGEETYRGRASFKSQGGGIGSPRSTAILNHARTKTRSRAYDEQNIKDACSQSSSAKSFASSSPYHVDPAGDDTDGDDDGDQNGDNVSLLNRIKERSSSQYDDSRVDTDEYRTGMTNDDNDDRNEGVDDSVFEVEFKRTNIAHWYDPNIRDDDEDDEDESTTYDYSVVTGGREADSHVMERTNVDHIERDADNKNNGESNLSSFINNGGHKKSTQQQSSRSLDDEGSSSSSSCTTTSQSETDHLDNEEDDSPAHPQDNPSRPYAKLNGIKKNGGDNSSTVDDGSAWDAFNQNYG